jgi:TctA family transporter
MPLLYVIGLVESLIHRYDVPVAPAMVGMILGPVAQRAGAAHRRSAIDFGDGVVGCCAIGACAAARESTPLNVLRRYWMQ